MGRFHRFAKLPNYVKRFGPLHGLSLLMRIERVLPKRSTKVKRYMVPCFPAPIHLRETVSDHAIFWQCMVKSQYDFRHFPQYAKMSTVYRTAISNGERPLIIDCGGNIGLATIWFATAFPEAMIYVLEPERENFEMLKRNTSFFGERVRLLQGGVWDEGGYLEITNPEAGSAAFRVTYRPTPAVNAIRAYTVDEICAMADVAAPFIVKIDVEGAQASLFRSNTEWVGKTHLITLELDDWLLPWQGTSRAFFSCLSRYPFDYLLGGENIFCFRDVDAGMLAHLQ